jgi:MscS family membrane protein
MPRPDGSRLDETIIRFLRQVAIVVILVAGIAIVLQRWGLDVGAIFAGLGIASLAVALAAQDALSNIIAYFAIVADTPFKVGDFIIIDGQNRGRVREITFRSTRIRTVDNSMLIIPNSKIANAQILNWERVSKRRLDFLLSLPKDTPQPLLEMFMAETRAMLAKNDQVSPERIVVEFVELTDSALKVRITFLAKANSWEDLEAVKTQVNLKLMKMTRTLALQVSSTVT